MKEYFDNFTNLNRGNSDIYGVWPEFLSHSSHIIQFVAGTFWGHI